MFFKKIYWAKIKNIRNKNNISDLIFFVTSKCNSQCKTCFYWRNLNKGKDLSLAEIQKISRSMPSFNSLLISGGEPFLRDDLPEIVKTFYDNNFVRSIAIPTNGLLTENIIFSTPKILTSLPKAVVSVNFSLDGLAKTHNFIRGVPRNFETTMKTIKALGKLKATYANLEIKVNTVICQENFNQLLKLAKQIANIPEIDGHYFEIIRGQSPDKSIQRLPKDKLKKLYGQLLAIQNKTFLKKNRSRNLFYRYLNHFIYLSRLIFLYRTQMNIFLNKEKWLMPCLAGKTALVLGNQGELSVCELRPPIGNIKDFNYDFKKFWISRVLEQERKKITETRCDCTHVCFIDASFSHFPRLLFFNLPWLYLKYQLFGVI